jgi:hypothetical protein
VQRQHAKQLQPPALTAALLHIIDSAARQSGHRLRSLDLTDVTDSPIGVRPGGGGWREGRICCRRKHKRAQIVIAQIVCGGADATCNRPDATCNIRA